MLQVNGGFRSPEDLRKTPLNPSPDPKQLEPDERVDRIRRILLNELENLPFFLVAGLLFVLTGPPLPLAQWLLYGQCGFPAPTLSRLFHRPDPRPPRHVVDCGLAHSDFHDGLVSGRRAGMDADQPHGVSDRVRRDCAVGDDAGSMTALDRPCPSRKMEIG